MSLNKKNHRNPKSKVFFFFLTIVVPHGYQGDNERKDWTAALLDTPTTWLYTHRWPMGYCHIYTHTIIQTHSRGLGNGFFLMHPGINVFHIFGSGTYRSLFKHWTLHLVLAHTGNFSSTEHFLSILKCSVGLDRIHSISYIWNVYFCEYPGCRFNSTLAHLVLYFNFNFHNLNYISAFYELTCGEGLHQ